MELQPHWSSTVREHRCDNEQTVYGTHWGKLWRRSQCYIWKPVTANTECKNLEVSWIIHPLPLSPFKEECYHSLVFGFGFGSTGVLNLGLHTHSAVPLSLEPHSQHFLLWLFWRQGFTFCLNQSWPQILLILSSHPSWDDSHVYPCTQLFPLSWGFSDILFFFFLPRLAWHHDPPNLCLSSS
jgi:hypothetical protein